MLAARSYTETIAGYQILKELGKGSFATVYKIKSFDTQKIYAMKKYDKNFLLQNAQMKYALREIQLLSKIDHPNIIKLYRSFQNQNYLHLILEYCEKDVPVPAPLNMTKIWMKQILQALNYLHTRGYVYRDFKPDNIRIKYENEGQQTIKLIDFGLAREQSLANSFCGSLAYLPPEVAKSQNYHLPASDIYAIGVLCYQMLTGTIPFEAYDYETLFELILKGNIFFPAWIPQEARNFIQISMSLNHLQRPTAGQLLEHEFITSK